MNRLKLLAVIAAFAVAHNPAMAADPEIDAAIDRFELWNECTPTFLLVEELSDSAAKIGLTKERIETTARSRLRAARIYSPAMADDPRLRTYLYVNVHVFGNTFSHRVEFKKELWLPETSGHWTDTGFATTWIMSGLGTHGQDAGYILQYVGEHIDAFIDEYLRVNAEAC